MTNWFQNQPIMPSSGQLSFGSSMPAAAIAPPSISPASVNVGSVVPGNAGGIGSAVAGGVTPQVQTGAAGAVGAQPGGFMGGFFGDMSPMEGISTALQGIGSIGQIYASLKGLKLARDQFDFTKSSYETNLANTTKSYNTTLEGRARARAAATRSSDASVDEYLAKHSM